MNGTVENVLVVTSLVGLASLVACSVGIWIMVWKRQVGSRATNEATRLSEIELDLQKLHTAVKLLRTEWADYHSRLDTLIKRAVRLGVIERKDGETAPAGEPPAMTTRADILRRHQERQRA